MAKNPNCHYCGNRRRAVNRLYEADRIRRFLVTRFNLRFITKDASRIAENFPRSNPHFRCGVCKEFDKAKLEKCELDIAKLVVMFCKRIDEGEVKASEKDLMLRTLQGFYPELYRYVFSHRLVR